MATAASHTMSSRPFSPDDRPRLREAMMPSCGVFPLLAREENRNNVFLKNESVCTLYNNSSARGMKAKNETSSVEAGREPSERGSFFSYVLCVQMPYFPARPTTAFYRTLCSVLRSTSRRISPPTLLLFLHSVGADNHSVVALVGFESDLLLRLELLLLKFLHLLRKHDLRVSRRVDT